MRNVYFGTSDFAATVLDALLESDHAPSLVVTRPARPKGRGKKLIDPPVARLAAERGVECFQPEELTAPEATERVLAADAQALTVCAYGAIIKEPLLSALPSFNVHPSLLPRWRGAAPIERAIAAGDAETGVSIMRLVEALDAGPVCAQERMAVQSSDDYGTLAPRLAELGGRMLVEVLNLAEAAAVGWTQQPEGGATYAEKIERSDRTLRPQEQSAEQIVNTVRALTPHIGAFLATENGEPLGVEAAGLEDRQLEPGEILTEDGRIFVGTTALTVELLRVKPAGGKAMDVESFLRGHEPPALA